MDIITAITTRASTRAFSSDPISKETLEQLFSAAKWAPSAVNTQPWRAHILQDPLKSTLSNAILAAREDNISENPDYHYYPGQWHEPFRSRRKACGLAMYEALGIARSDTAARKTAWDRNYQFFGAPVGVIFSIDSRLEKGSWLDMGMFLQNVMLAARHFGLESCPQASLAEYPDIVRRLLNIDHCYHIVCGLALGYADKNAAVNQYRTVREPLENFLTWHGE